MRTRRITVGLDNTPASSAALRYALNLAAMRERTEVLAVHAFELTSRPERRLERNVSAARRKLGEHCQRWIDESTVGHDTGVRIRLVVRDGNRCNVLVRAARDAEVLIVGAPKIGRSPATMELLAYLRRQVGCELVEVDENGWASLTVGDTYHPVQQFRQPA